MVLSKAPNKSSVSYHLQKTFSWYTIICVYEELKHRLHCLIRCFLLSFFLTFFYEIFLIQCPKGIQKGSGHFGNIEWFTS